MYTVGEVIYETLAMKLFPTALTFLQVIELSCYVSLFRAVTKHEANVSERKIIYIETFHKRKQKNLFSMYAQMSGFVLEILYLIFLLIIRITGRRYSLFNAREYADFLYVTQFGLTSTIQILVSSDLRQKLFSFLNHLLHR